MRSQILQRACVVVGSIEAALVVPLVVVEGRVRLGGAEVGGTLCTTTFDEDDGGDGGKEAEDDSDDNAGDGPF